MVTVCAAERRLAITQVAVLRRYFGDSFTPAAFTRRRAEAATRRPRGSYSTDRNITRIFFFLFHLICRFRVSRGREPLSNISVK